MINIKLGELYGMKDVKELMQTIQDLQNMGMSDTEIQEILDKSKEDSDADSD